MRTPSTAQPPSPPRAACLRGIEHGEHGAQLLVALSAEQYLRVPVDARDLPHWQARLGQRVWVGECPSKSEPGHG